MKTRSIGDIPIAVVAGLKGFPEAIAANDGSDHLGGTRRPARPDASPQTAGATSPALLLIETPSNPLMLVFDICGVTDQAKAAGAKVAVDNTFLSPALQQPLALGADYVIHRPLSS